MALLVKLIDRFKGPWRKGNSLSDVVQSAQGDYVCSVWGRTAAEIKLRTTLITLGPEMADALQDAVFHLEAQPHLDPEGRVLLAKLQDLLLRASEGL